MVPKPSYRLYLEQQDNQKILEYYYIDFYLENEMLFPENKNGLFFLRLYLRTI